MSGSSASARASATRLIMPPDSSDGNLFATAGVEADHFQLGDRDLVHQALRQVEIFAHRELHILAHRQRGEQRALLEQHAPAPLDRAAFAPSLALARSMPNTSMVPARLGSRPMMVRISTDLPAPEPPTKPRISPR